MRLKILNSGYGFGTKVLFAFIHMVSRHPVPDAAKLVFYRPDFYGAPMKEFTHQAMRGPSAWSVGDRELMAAGPGNGCQPIDRAAPAIFSRNPVHRSGGIG